MAIYIKQERYKQRWWRNWRNWTWIKYKSIFTFIIFCLTGLVGLAFLNPRIAPIYLTSLIIELIITGYFASKGK